MMEVDDRLLRLEEAKKRLKELEKDRQRSYAFWSLAKYYGQKEPWFTDFIHKEWVWWSELKFVSKPKGDPGMDVSYEYLKGLWAERLEILTDIEACEKTIDNLLEELIIGDSMDMTVIAPYFQTSLSGVFNAVRDRPWFQRRRDLRKKALDDKINL
jgi:hypothetical protein